MKNRRGKGSAGGKASAWEKRVEGCGRKYVGGDPEQAQEDFGKKVRECEVRHKQKTIVGGEIGREAKGHMGQGILSQNMAIRLLKVRLD